MFVEDAVQINKDLLGRTDREVFNVSFKEAMTYAQEGLSDEQIRSSIANVLHAFCARCPDLGYTQVR
jgi:hypothetical protein